MRHTRAVSSRTLLLVVALLGLTGCAQESGQATPATSTPSRASTTGSQTSPPTHGGALAQFDACGIFTAAEREKYDLPKGKLPETVGERGDCEWEVRDTSFGAGFAINILRKHGIEEIVGADTPPEPIDINGRQGVIYTAKAGTLCAITFGYGPHQRIDIIGGVAYAEDDSITECDVVKKFAKIVEPKLPERN